MRTRHLRPSTLSGSAMLYPDRRTPWVIVPLARTGAATCHRPRRSTSVAEPASLLLASRRSPRRVTPADPPRARVTDRSPLAAVRLGHFDFGNEPPLRGRDIVRFRLVAFVRPSPCLRWAWNGFLARLTPDRWPATPPDYLSFSSPRRPPTDAAWRLLRPADPVAPSPKGPPSDSFATVEVHLPGPHITAQIAEAATLAVRAHNAQRDRPLRRIGLSIARGGIRGEAATYRRLDLRPDDDVAGAVVRALAQEAVPTELGVCRPVPLSYSRCSTGSLTQSWSQTSGESICPR